MILVLFKRKEIKCLQVTKHQQGAFEIMVMQVVATTTWYHGLWHQGVYQWSSTERVCCKLTVPSAAARGVATQLTLLSLVLETQVKPLLPCERLQRHTVSPVSWACDQGQPGP